MHSIVLKIVIRKNSLKEREKKFFKHVRSYAATIEDRINILKHNNKKRSILITETKRKKL